MACKGSIAVRLLGAVGAMVLVCGPTLAQTSSSHATLQTVSSTSVSRRSKKLRKRASSRQRGQQKIDASRSREIQEALIREHYLDGTATGVWDAKSQSAMERYQSDNGWQSKVVPDSRALIKLGLGPDHEHLLNPESAMTSPVDATHASITSQGMMNQNRSPINTNQK